MKFPHSNAHYKVGQRVAAALSLFSTNLNYYFSDYTTRWVTNRRNDNKD